MSDIGNRKTFCYPDLGAERSIFTAAGGAALCDQHEDTIMNISFFKKCMNFKHTHR